MHSLVLSLFSARNALKENERKKKEEEKLRKEEEKNQKEKEKLQKEEEKVRFYVESGRHYSFIVICLDQLIIGLRLYNVYMS